MATDNKTATPGSEDAEGDDKEERKPYVVVLMSKEMKDLLKAYCEQNDTNPTALGRKLFADTIKYDISNEPAPTRRSVYTTDEERADAKKLASKKSGLLRKALFQVHMGQVKGKQELLHVANSVVLDLSDTSKKLTLPDLEALDSKIDAAIKAGK